MICTFGDPTDVTWWRELSLPTRPIIGWDGRRLAETPHWLSAPDAAAAYAELSGKTTFSARERIAELLRASGDLDGDPRPITHPVKFYENGDKPLEIVTTRQWYIRNGGRDDEGSLKAALIARGRELQWHPDYMRTRFENWIEGLNGDWLISRQRFFGVPFPVWYPLDANGDRLLDDPIVAAEDTLPVDPAVRATSGVLGGPARQGRRLRRRLGRHGHLGDVVAVAADRRRLGARSRPVRPGLPHGPAAAGARHHPHLAVRDRRARAPRARLPARGRTRRSPDSSSTPTARR